VLQEREELSKKQRIARYWLTQRAFYRDIPLADHDAINTFLLSEDGIAGLNFDIYNDPVIADVADVAEAYHDGVFRKASPIHPYMM
jgi:hypothetical protein